MQYPRIHESEIAMKKPKYPNLRFPTHKKYKSAYSTEVVDVGSDADGTQVEEEATVYAIEDDGHDHHEDESINITEEDNQNAQALVAELYGDDINLEDLDDDAFEALAVVSDRRQKGHCNRRTDTKTGINNWISHIYRPGTVMNQMSQHESVAPK